MDLNQKLKYATVTLAAFALAVTSGAQTAPAVRTTAHPAVRIIAKVDNTVTTRIPGTHPLAILRATSVQRLAPTTKLAQLHLVLNSSDEQIAALKSLADQQQDKTSPNYHQWLTPETFGQSFGAAPADIAKITAWMQDAGLTVTSVAKNKRIITFSGSSAQIEAAFQTTMSTMVVDGVTHVANTTDIAVPAAFAEVIGGVARLNDFFPTHQPIKVQGVSLKTMIPPNSSFGTTSAPLYGSSTGTHYAAPGDVATIFNTGPLTSTGTDGTGQTISVIAQSDISLGDVQTFRSIFGLPKNDPTITIVGQDPGQNQDDGEAYLDAEWSGALATGASIRFLVSAPSLEGGGIDASALYAVENNIGDIISLSYGGCETGNGVAGTAYWNSLWEQAAAQGQTAFVSSGDSGAGGCDSSSNSYATGGYGVNALGSSAYNVAVGGSAFVDFGQANYWGSTGGSAVPFNNALSYIPETPWNQGRLSPNNLNPASSAYAAGTGIVGGGGGISIYTARPSWQTGSGISNTADPTPAAPATGTGIAAGSPITGPHRLVPDLVNVAASSHVPVLYCADEICAVNPTGGLVNAGLVGGTSVATPVQAGMQALINQKNGGRQGNANYYYYPLANAQYTASTTACQATLGTAANPTVTLPASTCNFHDIVTGNNNVPTAATGTAQIGFSANVGFDDASGLGSMNVANVATNWSSVVFTATTTTFSITPAITAHAATQNISVTVTPTTGTGTPTGDFSLIAETTTPSGPFQYTLTNGAFNGTVASGGQLNTTQNVASLPAGSYKVHVHYAGDGVFGGSDSPSVPVTISADTTTLSLSPYNITIAGAVNPATSFNYGDDVYLDTYVVGSKDGGVPTGTVTYAVSLNGTALTSLTTTLDPQGNTYFMAGVSFVNFYLKANYAALAPGSYSVTATYSGDKSFAASSNTISFTVNPLPPAVTFTGPTSITSGQSAVFGYKITNPNTTANPNTTVVATGTVTFTDTTSGTMLGTVTLSGGALSLTTTAITASGANTITASYSGDANYAPIVSTLTTTVGTSTAPTVTVTTTSTQTVGTTIALKATLNPTTATGTVTFFDSGLVLGTATASSGVASLSYAAFTGGTHNISAVYSGSTSNASATGTLTLNIAKNSTTLRINAPANAAYGQPVIIDAYLGRSPSTTSQPAVQPSGLVTFTDTTTGNTLGSVTVFYQPGGYYYYGNSLTVTTLAAGQHVINATYAGDTNFTSATAANTTTVTVAPVSPAILLTSPATVYATGANVTLTATIALSAALTAPTGPVTFFDGSTQLGPAPLSYSAAAGGYVATYTASGLKGTQNFTAVLTADANYNSVTSAVLAIQITTNNVWVADSNGTVTGLMGSGAAVNPSGSNGGGVGIAIDNAGDIWSLNPSGNSVAEFSNTGTALSAGYTGGGINAPSALTIDGSGLVWVTNGNSTLSVLKQTGTPASTTAYASPTATPTSVNVDGSGNLWITNTGDNSLVEVVGVATPVTTPMTTAVKNSTVAAKP